MTKKDREKIAAVIAFTRQNLIGDYNVEESASDIKKYFHTALMLVACNLSCNIGIDDDLEQQRLFLKACGFTTGRGHSQAALSDVL